MNERLKQVGNRIQSARKAAGMSQADLAEGLDISVAHMSSIETGRANFSVEILMRLTEVLNVSADSLLRTNIPEVSAIYAKDIEALLKGCTSSEIEAIMAMMGHMKNALINARAPEY